MKASLGCAWHFPLHISLPRTWHLWGQAPEAFWPLDHQSTALAWTLLGKQQAARLDSSFQHSSISSSVFAWSTGFSHPRGARHSQPGERCSRRPVSQLRTPSASVLSASPTGKHRLYFCVRDEIAEHKTRLLEKGLLVFLRPSGSLRLQAGFL